MGNLEEFLKNKKLLDKYNKELQKFEIKKNKMTEKIDIEKFFEVMTEITQAASKMFIFECVYKLEQLLNDGVEFIDLKKDSDLGIFDYSIEQDCITLKKEDKFNSNIPFDLFLRDANAFDLLNDNPIINVLELQKYFYRLIEKGAYKSDYHKRKVFKKIFNLFKNENANIYNGETATITQRPYMLNDCSKLKSSLYQFLLSNNKKLKDSMKLNTNNKNKDEREFYLIEKIGKNNEPLSIEHISLLIALESVFMNCKEFIVNYETLFLKKSDLLHLFGENFRGDREEIFLKLIRDLSERRIDIDIIKGSKNIATGEVIEQPLKEIEGNLISFIKMRNGGGDSIYKITMPFLQDLFKRSTRNSLKSIELLKYTFKQPKKVLIAEYLSNIIFYHRKNGNKPKKISIKSILEQLGLYEEYKNMSAKDCNVYLERLKKDIDVASHMIRNVKNIKFTALSKSKIDDKSYGFTIYFKNENLEIED